MCVCVFQNDPYRKTHQKWQVELSACGGMYISRPSLTKVQVENLFSKREARSASFNWPNDYETLPTHDVV